MVVRAKFRLVAWKNSESSKWDGKESHPCILHSLEFVPVSANSTENKLFWDATPSGKIELGFVNPEATKEFNIGKEYYVDFIEAAE